MLTIIPQVLTQDEVKKIMDGISSGRFVDGLATAGDFARGVKKNLEFQRPENKLTEMDKIVANALMRNQTFSDFTLLKKMPPPIFSRYDPGMEYGAHVDSPIMGQNSPMRTDLSLTVFLSDPTTYDGGELTIITEYGEQQVKLPAGDAVVYSSTSLHRVQPVTRGSRWVALGWVQSVVQDEYFRQMLHDLSGAMNLLKDENQATPDDVLAARNLVFKSYANLLRRVGDV